MSKSIYLYAFLLQEDLKPEDYKQKYPQYFEDFGKKLYVGASRAKFKLHLMEYPLL